MREYKYKCDNCGHEFNEEDVVIEKEIHDELDNKAFEVFSYSPCCHDGYEPVFEDTMDDIERTLDKVYFVANRKHEEIQKKVKYKLENILEELERDET